MTRGRRCRRPSTRRAPGSTRSERGGPCRMSEAVPVVGRGFAFKDLRVGFRFRTHRRTIVEADLAAFVNLTWLTEELFVVKEERNKQLVPGALVYSFAEGLLL